MAKTRRSLSIYQIRPTAGGVDIVDFDQVIDPEVLPNVATYDLAADVDFEARLYADSPEPMEPAWVDFLRTGFGEDVHATETTTNRAVMVLRTHFHNATRYFALTFGAGRHMLKPDAVAHGLGLKAALNVVYEGDDPTAPSAPARVKRVDAQTVAENTLRTLRQANRYATFEAFGIDVQRDLLSAVTGEPAEKAIWGSRVTGGDAIYLNIPAEFQDLGGICRRLWRASRADHYKARFDWIDNVRIVEDPDELKRLRNLLIDGLREGEVQGLDLAPPQLVDWDSIESFSFSVRPDNIQPNLALDHYREVVADAGLLPELSLDHLSRHRARALDPGSSVLYEWPVLECLTGELRLGGLTYLLEEGQFFEIEAGYLRQLDTYLARLKECPVVLPDSTSAGGTEQTESDYNASAADASPDRLLLDKETVKVSTHTSPVEICDVLTVDRRFIHVKRKLQSNQLSHLFSQGWMSADLFLMSPEFRKATRRAIQRAERARAKATKDSGFIGRFADALNFDAPTPSAMEVVYAIIADWNGQSLPSALPFFSKVNLRRHVDDLRRMGYGVSYRRIELK